MEGHEVVDIGVIDVPERLHGAHPGGAELGGQVDRLRKADQGQIVRVERPVAVIERHVALGQGPQRQRLGRPSGEPRVARVGVRSVKARVPVATDNEVVVGVLAGLEHDQARLVAVKEIRGVGEHGPFEAVGDTRPQDEPRRAGRLLLIGGGVVVVVVKAHIEESLDLGRGIEGREDDDLVGGEPKPERFASRFEPAVGRRVHGAAVDLGERLELVFRSQANDAFLGDRLAHERPSIQGMI